MTSPTGEVRDCSPYQCVGSACLGTCTSAADCQAGFECTSAGICATPTATGSEGGCAVAVPTKEQNSGVAAFFAMLFAARRRRRSVG